MILTMLAILALNAAGPPATGAGSDVPPASADDDPPASLEGLQQVYDQSCAAREYGAYDDLCDQLSQQLKAARTEMAREARRKAAQARRRAPAAPTPPKPTAPAVPPSAPAPSSG